MRFKGTFALLIAGVVVIGSIFFFERWGERREKAGDLETRLWDIEDERTIVRIDLFSDDTHIIAERLPEKRWLLTAPEQYDADTGELNRLARNAVSLRSESTVETDTEDPGRFGLEPSRSWIKLTLEDGREYLLDLGINNPTGSSTYASIRGSSKVVMIPALAAESFSKQVDDLRDRNIIHFERQEVQSLTISNPKGLIELVKDLNNDWWHEGMEKRAANGPDVRSILNSLSLERITGFFNGNIADYENHRLDRPLIELHLTHVTPDGNRNERLIVGNEKSQLRSKRSTDGKSSAGDDHASDTVYLAKSDSRPDLFFVGKSLVDRLLVSADDIRDTSLAFFQRWNVDSIELTNRRGKFTFFKSGGEWFLGDERVKADLEAVHLILDALEKPVIEWIDDPESPAHYGLDKPAVHVILKQGETVIADVSVGKESEVGIFAMVAGDRSVKVADPDIIEALDRDEPAFLGVPSGDASER
jgi:hypothetical protein